MGAFARASAHSNAQEKTACADNGQDAGKTEPPPRMLVSSGATDTVRVRRSPLGLNPRFWRSVQQSIARKSRGTGALGVERRSHTRKTPGNTPSHAGKTRCYKREPDDRAKWGTTRASRGSFTRGRCAARSSAPPTPNSQNPCQHRTRTDRMPSQP
ncbi:hypothetical protein DENSPDRAFT_887366 [Dentipellis sp. KUC8613]|nr:hypothetical protein DENSPDRAFT_887366 [Dentipellis sp. KUC8613]